MSLLPAYRGVRILPFMEKLRYFIFSFFFLLFSPILGFYIYQNLEKLKNADVPSIVIVSLMVIVFSLISLYLTWLSQERLFYFQKRERESKLAFFLRENGYTYTKKVKTDSGTRDKVVFPVVYMKQNRYDLEIAFKMAGNKFQDKFKKIGSDLETTFFMDFMEVQDDVKFKTYKLAYSAFLNRIKVTDVNYSDKGIQLMKNLYWNPVDDPHLLVCGGTGGGKTVLLRTLIRAMAKVGVVDICDPKQADFVTMSEQKAFEGRISYEVEDIVSMIGRAVQIMFARYAYMRKMREENGDKDLKKFFEYGLEPYFLVCDEYNALCAMLDFQTRQRLDNAMGQFLLLGRQAGCFATIAMQKPSREDLGSKLQSNINFRISVGRLDEVGYDLAFGEVNRNKEFKYVKYLAGKRVYGRGYASVYGEVAREFYSPLLSKEFSFFDEYDKIQRRENPFNPLENPEAVLSEEEKQALQEEMQANEELEKGTVKKDSSELVQELMSSKQKEYEENDFPDGIYLSDFALEKGIRSNILRNVIQKIEEQGFYSFERKEGKIFLDLDSKELLSKMIDDREESNKGWGDLISEYFRD
ncbi:MULTISPECIES: FtsK/SpoIIIE domain-containing protein [Streptococcus]|uniref:FtsK/SpoIIIE domain-containing protein n=1 Tax=Streptococcus TaxID=1301 RepID=UPI0005E06EDE|nr:MULTISPECIES: FtsK/SpoIIIE domain-containing protein [Streptococcus]MBF9648051.1 cell division protein FtsK [Streptococcus pseudopneumoniae]MBW8105728.1 cell division protein FtsK [Streptococcus pseudopneumoniae]NIB94349.1 cell division protein FtsK [Streptococcus pseudopneumoniae]CJQ09595.1 ICESt1 ORFK%2C FtsK/SpoIIIE family protein [Streptococcus pneumoniae]CKG59525.1 ICESt1 ORFK%2C FtsK/SpoIIIE family protein [Streptococcus pneumoniae]